MVGRYLRLFAVKQTTMEGYASHILSSFGKERRARGGNGGENRWAVDVVFSEDLVINENSN